MCYVHKQVQSLIKGKSSNLVANFLSSSKFFFTAQASLAIQGKMYDYIVIGAGINGSWSALHLAKRGHKVLLLEQVKFLVHLS